MVISIDINGVVRDTIGKLSQVYEKYMMSEMEISDDEVASDQFKYEINLPVNTTELINHFKFRDREEMFSFMYEEFPMEIFGHAGSVEYLTMDYLNSFYINNRDKHVIYLVSDEIKKSKPATLFFLSKFGCLIENITFYNHKTIDSMIENTDILLTANPKLFSYDDKVDIVKFNTEYNRDIQSKYEISSLKEFENLIINKFK